MNMRLGAKSGGNDIVFQALDMTGGPLIVVSFVTSSVDSCDWLEVKGSKQDIVVVVELDVGCPFNVLGRVGVDVWGE